MAQTAAKSLVEIQHMGDESDTSSKEDETQESETDDESEKMRKLALDKLEKASEDSLLGQASDVCQFFSDMKYQ